MGHASRHVTERLNAVHLKHYSARHMSDQRPIQAANAVRPWVWLLAALAVARLCTLGLYPLADATESRYAEVARLMVALDNWVTPHITPTENFWAKPPLSTWSQAAFMKVLGVSAFAARLPALLWSALALWGLWAMLAQLATPRRTFALVVLASCPLFFIAAGAVMTDASLIACSVWMQAAFWRAMQAQDTVQRRRWGRVLALACGLALLAKGPAALVLGGLPALMYMAWTRRWREPLKLALDPLAWLIVLVVAVPWYVLAELRTPGFLQYFILGEHVMRFTVPGWTGDRYGFAHSEPLGIIWLYLLVAALPWLLALAIGGLVNLRGRPIRSAPSRLNASLQDSLGGPLKVYALCILLAPMLLFSFSRNLIWTYALTGLPGLAILCAAWLDADRRSWQIFVGVLTLGFALALGLVMPDEAAKRSQAPLIQAYLDACPQRGCRLVYLDSPPYSARFYSDGLVYDPPQQSANGQPAFFVVEMDDVEFKVLATVGQLVAQNPRWALFRVAQPEGNVLQLQTHADKETRQ
jgi:4-amino-4-deoxy-L-arabinose transferase-like glycosyltransferase